MGPSQASAELRRLAAYVARCERPSLSAVRFGAGRILKAMEEAPQTLRSPQSVKPGLEDTDWDWYLGAFGDVRKMVEEARDQGPDEEGYLADSIGGFADSLKDLAETLGQAEAGVPSKPVQDGSVQGAWTIPPIY